MKLDITFEITGHPDHNHKYQEEIIIENTRSGKIKADDQKGNIGVGMTVKDAVLNVVKSSICEEEL